MTKISDLMVDLNPWWKEDFSLSYYEREIYGQLSKFMPMPQVIALTGLRRVGKTTLMRKMVKDAIDDGFPPMNILFFSFDEFRNTDIRDVLREYERIVEMDIGKGKYLLLLDEIQKLDDWEDGLKSIYDIYKDRIKIIISGSESLFIRKKSKETLQGRIFDFRVEKLSFHEFLNFKQVNYQPVGVYEKELSLLFEEFMRTQGFPELVGITDKDIIKKYVHESIVGRIIFKDIPTIFNIKEISVLESLFRILFEEPGQMLDLADLAIELKVSRATVSNYLKYLEESFLVQKLYNYSPNRRKQERKLKKYYPAVISVDLSFKDDSLYRSRVFEWLTVTQSRAEFFWRDTYKNEVDMVLGEETAKPVEIKYGKLNFKGLLAFMRKFKIDRGEIISRREEMEKDFDGKSIRVIPAYKYFLEVRTGND